MVRQGKTVVLATHDLAAARAWADLAVFMQAGRVLIAAPPEQLFTDPALLAATGLDRVVFR